MSDLKSTACTTPDKQRYRSQAEANRAERSRRAHTGRLYPYECTSGEHWHLTHHTPEKQAAVFNHENGSTGLPAVSNRLGGTGQLALVAAS